jgi:hypothetical protein
VKASLACKGGLMRRPATRLKRRSGPTSGRWRTSKLSGARNYCEVSGGSRYFSAVDTDVNVVFNDDQRWSRFPGQNGGLAKVDSGFDYAANFSSFACVA